MGCIKLKIKSLLVITIILLLLITLTQFFVPSPDVAEFEADFGDELFYDSNLAKKWAPRIYQQVSIDKFDKELEYAPDYITNVEFDGDWGGDNNWDNLPHYRDNLNAYVYYWGFEKDGFTFLGYMLFHPRDWTNQIFDGEHENDMEGVFILLKNDSSGNEIPISLSTIAHSTIKHYQFGNLEDVTKTSSIEKVSGNVKFYPNTTSPIIYVESGGHGIYGLSNDLKDTTNKNYIEYVVGDTAENPDNVNIKDGESVGYKLIPIKTLWDKRNDKSLFSKSGYVKSDLSGTCGLRMLKLRICKTEAALPPWLWSQGQTYPGQLWYEPIELLYNLFNLDQIFD